MTGNRLFRLGGLSAIVGGALLVIDVIPHLFINDTLRPEELGGLTHEMWHVPGIISLPLALLGLIAIYLGQSGESARLGLWGFLLLVIGMTVGAIYSTIFHGIFVPAFENIEAGLIEKLVDNTTVAQFPRGFIVQAFGLGLGAILFGVATIRAKVFPAVTGWIFIAAALFAAANQFFSEGQLISRALFGASFIWMGFDLRSRTQTD